MFDECATVAVIDSDADSHAVLRAMLQAAGLCVESFDSTGQYLLASRSCSVACIVMEIQHDGIAFQARLVSAGDPPPIVFITSRADVRACVHAIRGGAIEYLVRPVQRTELLEAVRGGIACNFARLAESKALREVRDRFYKLSPREREVMMLLSNGSQAKQIAGTLNICTHTARVHSNRVMSKLGARSLADLIRMADKLTAPVTDAASCAERKTISKLVPRSLEHQQRCASARS